MVFARVDGASARLARPRDFFFFPLGTTGGSGGETHPSLSIIRHSHVIVSAQDPRDACINLPIAVCVFTRVRTIRMAIRCDTFLLKTKRLLVGDSSNDDFSYNTKYRSRIASNNTAVIHVHPESARQFRLARTPHGSLFPSSLLSLAHVPLASLVPRASTFNGMSAPFHVVV